MSYDLFCVALRSRFTYDAWVLHFPWTFLFRFCRPIYRLDQPALDFMSQELVSSWPRVGPISLWKTPCPKSPLLPAQLSPRCSGSLMPVIIRPAVNCINVDVWRGSSFKRWADGTPLGGYAAYFPWRSKLGLYILLNSTRWFMPLLTPLWHQGLRANVGQPTVIVWHAQSLLWCGFLSRFLSLKIRGYGVYSIKFHAVRLPFYESHILHPYVCVLPCLMACCI